MNKRAVSLSKPFTGRAGRSSKARSEAESRARRPRWGRRRVFAWDTASDHNQSGQILLSALTIALLVLLVSIAVLSFASVNYRLVKRSQFESQTISAAEAGIEHAIRQLNLSGSYAGETDTSFGDGTFTITVTGSGSTRTIEASSCIPDCTNPRSERTIRVQASINTDDVEFFYGIQVDSGGISMGNNATVNGNVYSNGSITGGNGSTITGDATVAGGLDADPAVEWTTENSDQFFATTSGNRDIAQSFVSNETGDLAKVSVFLGKVGNPTANITLKIADHNATNNRPETGNIASATIDRNSVGTTPSWIDVSFSSPPNLTNGTKYWIVLDYSTFSATNYWNWRRDTLTDYTNNTGKYTSNCCSGSPSWTDIVDDLAFRAWIGGTTTKIDGMTIGNSTTGTGRANLFVNTSIHGSSCPNQYCIVENPSRENLPISDGVIADWKNDAAAGGTHNGDYTISNGDSASLGPMKITGKLTVDNNATLIITGTLWVVGDIVLSNDCIVRLDAGYGANSGLLLTDNKANISNNCTFEGSGDPNSYVMLLSDKNSNTEEIITVDNNALGVIYYAGKGRIKFSNNGAAKEATGYGITMDNNAVVTYESGLANVHFTSGPGGGWSIISGTWQEIK